MEDENTLVLPPRIHRPGAALKKQSTRLSFFEIKFREHNWLTDFFCQPSPDSTV
jgi:hypothetical protein